MSHKYIYFIMALATALGLVAVFTFTTAAVVDVHENTARVEVLPSQPSQPDSIKQEALPKAPADKNKETIKPKSNPLAQAAKPKAKPPVKKDDDSGKQLKRYREIQKRGQRVLEQQRMILNELKEMKKQYE